MTRVQNLTAGRRRPVSMTGLSCANAWPWRGRLSFRLLFGKAEGPAPVGDGRTLIAMLDDHELAEVLAAIPALAMNAGSFAAVLAVLDLLRGEQRSRFAGVRKDDLAAVLPRVAGQLTLTPDERAAVTRLQNALDHLAPAAAAADGGGPDGT